MQEKLEIKTNRIRVRSIANKLLKACKVTEPPVKLSVVAKHLDIIGDTGLTEFMNRKGISAFIEKESKIVSYNDRHPVVRKRFSVAHEIGHFVLGHSIKDDIFKLESNDPREIVANMFAAELLIPYNWIKKDLAQFEVKNKDLAWKYWVSEEAMGWRLFNSDGLLK